MAEPPGALWPARRTRRLIYAPGMKIYARSLASAALALSVGVGSAAAAEDAFLASLRAAISGLGSGEAVPSTPRSYARPDLAQTPTGFRFFHAVLEKSTVKCQGPLGASATFKDYDVRMAVDLSDLTRSQMEVTVRTDSVAATSWYVSTSFIKRRLKVDQYPTATMKSIAIRATKDPQVFDADVEFTLIGETYKGTFPVRIAVEGDGVHIQGAAALTLGDGTPVSESYDVVLAADPPAPVTVRTER